MKINLIIDLIFFLAFLSFASAVQPGCVELYEHCNYQGRVQTICLSSPAFYNFNFSNIVSAVKLGPNTGVILFSENEYKGRRLEVSVDTPCLVSKSFNDVANSARVLRLTTRQNVEHKPTAAPKRPESGCILAFEQCNYEGYWAHICTDLPNLGTIGLDNKISSVKVNIDVKATFFDQVNFKGLSQTWTDDDSCFDARKFNDLASSVQVRLRPEPIVIPIPVPPVQPPAPQDPTPAPVKGCVIAFEQINYQGRWLGICGSVPNLDSIEFNDLISSAKVGTDTVVDFFEDANYGGNVLKLAQSSPNFGIFNRIASSVRVSITFPVPLPRPVDPPKPVLPPERPANGCAMIFEHINFEGKYMTVCNQDIRSFVLLGWNDTTSSIKVGPHTKAVLYEHIAYGGKQISFVADNGNFVPLGWNDIASSVKVHPIQPVVPPPVVIPVLPPRPGQGCVYLFEHINYGGKVLNVCGSIANFVPLNWYDIASSIKVGTWTDAIVYEHINYQGKQIKFSNDAPDFRLHGWNDIASSIRTYKIEPSPPKPRPVIPPKPQPPTVRPQRPSKGHIVLFENINYGGKWLDTSGSLPNLVHLGWNDILSSIWVGPQTRATLYENINYSGKEITLGADNSNFVPLGWNDITSSIRVFVVLNPLPLPSPVTPPQPLPPLHPSPNHGCAYLFEHANFSGKYIRTCLNLNNFATFGFKNNISSSIKIGPFTSATIFNQINYQGKSTTYKTTATGLNLENFAFSSIEVQKIVLPLVPVIIQKEVRPKSGCVILYELINYGGKRLIVCGSIANFVPLGWNVNASSIQVGPLTYAILYEQINFQGKNNKFSSDKADFLRFGWYDITSSIRVFKIAPTPPLPPVPNPPKPQPPIIPPNKPLKGCAIIFEHINFSGRWLNTCGSIPNLVPLGWNDITSSISVGPETRAQLFEHINYTGRTITLANNHPNFVSLKWNDITSSIKIYKYVTPKPLPSPPLPPKPLPRVIQNPGIGCVVLFEHINFEGESVLVCEDIRNFVKLGWKDKVSSVKVGPNTHAILYKHIDYDGSQISLKDSIPTLIPLGWDDVASSIRVTTIKSPPIIVPAIPPPGKGCIIMYEHINYLGKLMKVCGAIPNFVPLGWNDIVSSTKVGPETSATFFEHIDYKGRHIELSGNVPNFVLLGWNDIASSVKVFIKSTPIPLPPAPQPPKPQPPVRTRPDAGCYMVYEHINFEGRWLHSCGSISDLRRVRFNDIISSIKVGALAKVILYEHIEYDGKNVAFTQDDANFVKRNFNDITSSIKLFRIERPPEPPKPRPVTPVEPPRPVDPPAPAANEDPEKGCIIFYEHINFGGRARRACNSIPNLANIHWNDLISSAIVGPWTQANFYEHVDYKGRVLILREEAESNFVNFKFNGITSSIRLFNIPIVDPVNPPIIPPKPHPPVIVLPERGCVVLYEHINYRGKSLHVCKDIQNLLHFGWKDITSSIKVGFQTSAILYQDALYSGKKLIITANNANFAPLGWNDNTSSIQVRIINPDPIPVPESPARPNEGCVLMFEHIDYKGKWMHVCGSIANFVALGWNDILSSAKVGVNTKVEFYEHINFGGKVLVLNADASNFVPLGWNDIASSVKVFKLNPLPDPLPRPVDPPKPQPPANPAPRPTRGCAVLFEHVDYKGKWLKICGSIPNFVLLQWKDIGSSAWVGPQTKAVFYAHVNYTGRILSLTLDENNFVTRNFNDIASSVMVYALDLPTPIPQPPVPPHPHPPTPDHLLKGCVVLFEHIDYKGKFLHSCKDIPDFVPLGWNDIVSSVKVGPDTIATLYEHINYTGKELSLREDKTNFVPIGWNDIASSLKITMYVPKPVPVPGAPLRPHDGCVLMFEHIDYQGKWMEVCGSIANFVPLGWNHILSSVKVGDNTKVEFYEHINFVGKVLVLNADASNFVPLGWNDIASSVKVFKLNPLPDPLPTPVDPPKPQPPATPAPRPTKGCVVLFEHVDYKGNWLKICGSIADFAPLKWNDIGSSAWIGPQTQGDFYENINYTGRVLSLTADLSNFVSKHFDDIASSVKVIALEPPTPIPQPPKPPVIVLPVPEPDKGCVVLFEHVNYEGKWMRVCGSIENLVPLGWNDIASSIKVGPSTQATLYEQINYKGKTLDVKNNNPNFVLSGYHDKASSIKVSSIIPEPILQPPAPEVPEHGCVFMYENINYGGKWMRVCGSIANFVPLGWNGILSSVKVGPDTKATFYHDINYAGTDISFTTNHPDFNLLKWNDIASSVRVFKLSEPVPKPVPEEPVPKPVPKPYPEEPVPEEPVPKPVPKPRLPPKDFEVVNKDTITLD